MSGRCGQRPAHAAVIQRNTSWFTVESVGESNVGRWRGSGTRFVPRSSCYPHLEPICGYLTLGHPNHTKYRSVKTAVATRVALVVPPPLVPARAGRPPCAPMSPVPCVSRRRIIMHRTSCLCQPAPWPPRCRHPPSPPRPQLPAPLHPELTLCPLHPISIDRRRPCHMVGRGASPGEVGVIVLRVEVSWKVLPAQRSLLADAKCGSDVGTSDVGRRPTFYPHLIPTPDLPTLSSDEIVRCLASVACACRSVAQPESRVNRESVDTSGTQDPGLRFFCTQTSASHMSDSGGAPVVSATQAAEGACLLAALPPNHA